MFFVYILKSSTDGKLYIGSTNDLRHRLSQHNTGKVFSTRLRVPFELIYYEAYKVERGARKREHNLKFGARARRQLMRRIKESIGV